MGRRRTRFDILWDFFQSANDLNFKYDSFKKIGRTRISGEWKTFVLNFRNELMSLFISRIYAEIEVFCEIFVRKFGQVRQISKSRFSVLKIIENDFFKLLFVEIGNIWMNFFENFQRKPIFLIVARTNWIKRVFLRWIYGLKLFRQRTINKFFRIIFFGFVKSRRNRAAENCDKQEKRDRKM